MITCMIIDDNELSLISLNNFLLSEGFSVHAFASPLEALEVAQDNYYDLIISDFRLPHMNGINLIEKVRAYQPTIKSILTTGYYTENTVVEARKACIDHFFPKPICIHELMDAIYKMIPYTKVNNYI